MHVRFSENRSNAVALAVIACLAVSATLLASWPIIPPSYWGRHVLSRQERLDLINANNEQGGIAGTCADCGFDNENTCAGHCSATVTTPCDFDIDCPSGEVCEQCFECDLGSGFCGCVRSDFSGPPCSGGCPEGMVCCENCGAGGLCLIPCGGCITSPECTDHDACTFDTCESNFTCTHSMLDCSDDNPCTDEFCDTQQGCQYPLHVCDDMNDCTLDGCDEVTGCVATPNCCDEHEDCDDNNDCPNDFCDMASGFCIFNSPSCSACTGPGDCIDGDPCTMDVCDAGTCDNPPLCTTADPCLVATCAAGVCGTEPVDCDDGNACTDDSCMAGFGCIHPPTDCVDTDGCTMDSCDMMMGCQNIMMTGCECDEAGDCIDSDPCTTASCMGGICTFMNTCECTMTSECVDSNPCTDDSCEKGACVNEFNMDPCDDGNECTENDACSGGACDGSDVDCEDDDPCTTHSCDPVAGCMTTTICGCSAGNCCTDHGGLGCNDAPCCECVCATDPFCCDIGWDSMCSGAALDSCAASCDCVPECGDESAGDCCVADGTPYCDDASCCNCVCSIDSFCCTSSWDSLCAEEAACECAMACGNECDPTALACCTDADCNDNNPCTDDSCVIDTVFGDVHMCVNEPTGGSAGGAIECDGNLCTIEDSCSDGVCNPGMTTVMCVDDGNECTTVMCNPATGDCDTTLLTGTACSDDNSCTTADTCVNGMCIGGLPPGCNDGIDCTNDSCDPVMGCMNVPNNAKCEDGNDCTTDLCLVGVPGSPDGCNFPCTDMVDPTANCPPAMVDVECGQPVPPFPPMFSDNCDDMLMLTAISNISIGECPVVEMISRSASAEDDCENTFSCSQLVNIVDTTPPQANCPPAEITIECDQPIPPLQGNFTDACDEELESVPTDCTVVPGTCLQERDVTCTVAVEDDCQNVAFCTQLVHVVDTTPPVVECQPVITARCRSEAGVAVEDIFIPDGTAVDNCDMYTPVTDDRRTSGFYPPTCDGPGTLITYTSVDDCGNVGTCETRVRVIGGMCCPAETDTDLKLVIVDLDLRQDHEGPPKTKARFDIWNSNEVRFSGTERCIICWDETLISQYGPIANHFLLDNLQTDKGKARIHNDASTVCPESQEHPLLGVAIKETRFAGSPHVEMRSAVTLVGIGEQAAVIQYDIIVPPDDESNLPDGDAPQSRTLQGADARGMNAAALNRLIIAQAPLPGVGPTAILNTDPEMPLGGSPGGGSDDVSDNRASTTFKGSLIIWPVIEVKWDAYGNLIQDTFIQLLNDNTTEVRVQLYQVNGDAPLDAVINENPPFQILERAHPGWNNSDYQITLTGDQSTYWSVATGQPEGVSPFFVLDAGNPNGRPDLDPSNPGGRVIRGFLVGWAVDDDGHEIRWNHLKGHAVSVRYDEATAYDYNPWNFRVVSGVPEGAESDDVPGQLLLDGFEYDLAPNALLLDFFAAGSQALSHPSLRD